MGSSFKVELACVEPVPVDSVFLPALFPANSLDVFLPALLPADSIDVFLPALLPADSIDIFLPALLPADSLDVFLPILLPEDSIEIFLLTATGSCCPPLPLSCDSNGLVGGDLSRNNLERCFGFGRTAGFTDGFGLTGGLAAIVCSAAMAPAGGDAVDSGAIFSFPCSGGCGFFVSSSSFGCWAVLFSGGFTAVFDSSSLALPPDDEGGS